jgi:hypothetical protein
VIVEECLYFSEISPINVYINRLLLDNDGNFKLNVHTGDTLELDISEKWGLQGFDLVVGNPPYNKSQENKGKKGGGDLLWNKFVNTSLNQWLLPSGYLVFVHPSGWRKPESQRSKYRNMFSLMTKENQMLALNIHGTQDGMKTFGCGTRYDWYLIQRIPSSENTIVRGED